MIDENTMLNHQMTSGTKSELKRIEQVEHSGDVLESHAKGLGIL